MITRARINEIISEELGVEPEQVTETADLAKDLGADSLDVVELVMALEEEDYGLDITDEQIETWKTVGDVYRTLGAES
ncbi:MAG: acyl carrier protein [Gemmatimonadota bacterium]